MRLEKEKADLAFELARAASGKPGTAASTPGGCWQPPVRVCAAQAAAPDATPRLRLTVVLRQARRPPRPPGALPWRAPRHSWRSC